MLPTSAPLEGLVASRVVQVLAGARGNAAEAIVGGNELFFDIPYFLLTNFSFFHILISDYL